MNWIKQMALAFRAEMTAVFSDMGVMIFFFLLPLAYPIVYSLIYNPEVTRDMPVAVVDHSRTSLSREFIRHADATEAMKICGYASSMEEAKQWMAEKKCFGVFEIPADYAQKLGRAEQPAIQFYSDMTLLLRYRTFLQSLTDLQIATGAELRQMALDDLGVPSYDTDTPGSSMMAGSESIGNLGFPLGDTQQGFASFIIPGIVVLILQQSMLLGIVMLGGTRAERRRGYSAGDYSRLAAVDALSPSAQIWGRTFCYVALYLPITIYMLHYVLVFFHYPHQGLIPDYFLMILPMLLASAMLGQALNAMASERESAFIIVVFTSVAFLFLSGLTWPRYAMPALFSWLGDIVPATWGLEGFVRINSNGGSLALQSRPYFWLWGLTAVYTIAAYAVTRYQTRRGALPAPGVVTDGSDRRR